MLGDTTSVLEVDAVSKLYSRSVAESRKRLAGSLWRTVVGKEPKPIGPLQPGEFWGLKDISFTLKRGEALGVIGLNGSGKTTLLRILAGQILPDTGEIRILGRTAAMIDLTAGFQMGASGRENIYLRGAMLGRSRAEMEAAAPEIIDFAELGDAIAAPVRTYSSGMLMRLAFAIMVASTPDILFIDEILAVGDFRFRQKCLAKIREMRERCAFVLVTHSMSDVKRFCTRALVLNRGSVSYAGNVDEAIKHYQAFENPESAQPARRSSLIPAEVYRKDLIENVEVSWEGLSDDGVCRVDEGGALSFVCRFRLRYTPKNLVVGIPVYDENGTLITGFATDSIAMKAAAGDRVKAHLRIENISLNPGHFRPAIGIVDGAEHLFMTHLPDLHVRPKGGLTWGTFTPPYTWNVSHE